MNMKRSPGLISKTMMSRSRMILLLVLFITMISGFFFVRGSWISQSNNILKQAMDIARTVEASLSKEALAALDVSEKDVTKPEYEMLKNSLVKIIEVNSEFQFAYIYTRKEGNIYFIADSEPADSPEYSPPGQEYAEADEEARMPFESGEPLVTKPATDRWGTWISMLVPMKDSLSDKTIAVFGMDYPAELWNRRANSYAIQGAVYVAALMLLITAFYMITRKNRMLRKSQADLIRAKEIAETATKSKSTFLANMSHEIRTPMNAVIGFLGLLAKTDMTLKQQDYVHKIESSARVLLGIINDILDFSKIEVGKLEIETVNFQLDEVINNIVEMIAVKAAEKNIELLSNVHSDVPRALVGDPLRLGQILVNLASNAVKFTDKGHILIKAELLSKDPTGCRIKFSVQDTGIGMTAEQVEKMFTAFSQADSSITRRFGGTGLGLTISKRLAEMMDGEISIESQQGVGSTFTYAALFKRQTEIRESKTPDMEKLRTLKVLIVDDSEMARTILAEHLFTFGIHAAQADSGQAAIEEIRRASQSMSYDLVLMDLRMPDMDGLETARKIRADQDIAHMPLIIIVSAFGREEIVKQAENIGIRTFLMKPVNPHLLRDILLNAFGEAAAEASAHTPDIKPTAVRADGLRVLLAEDNVLNQEVATEILRSAGISVEIANNGKEAVEAVTNTPYDIVLMDIQMPVMGGYEATKHIRSIDQYKDLPIIAMTAHAMQGAREECLEAGMNDYISKPIDPDSLLLTIQKWMRPGAAIDRAPNEPAAKNPDKYEETISLPQGLSGIDIEAGLKRLNGNRKLYKKLLFDFAGSYSSIYDDISRALKQDDTGLALRLVHTLKGVASNISALEIQTIAVDLEKALTRNSARETERLLLNLDKTVKSMIDTLNELLEPFPAAPAESENVYDTGKAETLLLDLARLIWEDNVNAEQSLEELRKVIGPAVYGEDMKALAASIGDYDFDTAKAALQRIAGKMNIVLAGY